MARPLEPTPILEGKDKEDFLKKLTTVKYDKKKETFLKECDNLLNAVNFQAD